MLDFIMVPAILGIISAGIYGLFELFVRRNERMAIIEKIGDKLNASAFDGKLNLPSYQGGMSFSALKFGLLLAGCGLGLLIGFIIGMSVLSDAIYGDNYQMRQTLSVVYGSSVLLFGGLGLVIAFIIEVKLGKKDN